MRSTPPLLTALLLLLAGCGGPDEPRKAAAAPARSVPEVWTTFYPTTYFTERIAGGSVKVVCPLPEGEDPAFWQPDSATLLGYQGADLIVVNGAGFEAFVAQASLPVSRLVAAAQGFAERWITFEGAVTHSHGGGAAHTHEGVDGHTWLDPLNARDEAAAIHRALVRRLPARQAALDAGWAALAKDLDGLDAAFRALGPLPAGKSLYTSHPAWNYLAKRYGWTTVGFTLEPQSPVTDAQVAQIRESLAAKPATHMLWEEPPLAATRERLQHELGLAGLVVPPCESESADDRAKGRDYLARMRANVETLRAAFAGN